MSQNEEKNISCNIFLEQLELINQAPLEERGTVAYLALLKAFSRAVNQLDNQDEIQDANQVENQLENIYISISKSISISILSNTILNLLNKTLDCRIYNKNWGGKRTGSGKKSLKVVANPDFMFDDNINKCFELYKTHCKTLIKISNERRNNEILTLLNETLQEIGNDLTKFAEICKKADEIEKIGDYRIDFKMMLKNYIGILNGKYDKQCNSSKENLLKMIRN